MKAPKLCVALDLPTKESNLTLAQSLKIHSKNLWLKVGLRSFVRDGKEFLKELRNIGDFKLFWISSCMIFQILCLIRSMRFTNLA